MKFKKLLPWKNALKEHIEKFGSLPTDDLLNKMPKQ